jgi:hypothetical protein
MSDTPETNAAWRELRENNRVQPLLYLANKLERERDNIADQRDMAISEMDRLEEERDQARNLAESAMLEADRLRSQLWRARDWVFRLRKQRAIARNFGKQMERERDHWKSESLEQAKLLAMSADREEKLRAKEAKP